MEEDEETYGFGSFSDLFGAAPAAAKRLDVGALSRFCMLERLLSRFQQQQRRDKPSVLYQHVAAKFDGVSIDGGLGALSFTSLEGGGVVWQQTAASDSDALERRKKELQDITNQPQNDVKSAAAVFVRLKQVETVKTTSMQNKVQGVEMVLKGGNRLEVTFMPGPFFKATHRDEFLTLLKEKMTTEGEQIGRNETTRNGTTVVGSIQVEEVGKNSEMKATEMHTAGRNLDGFTGVIDRRMLAREGGAKKEELRRLVRRYTLLDELSEEGLAVAKQVHEETGYHLGPTTKQIPKFSTDAAYRKKIVVELTGFVERMNQEWKEADRQRELHTKAKHSRNDDDLFEYTDTGTGALIPVRTYEQRYLNYVKAHEVNPVLHMFPVPEMGSHEVSSKASKADIVASVPQRSMPTTLPKADENARRISSMFTATLGVDISSSCIIDKDFFSPAVALTPPNVPARRSEDEAFRAIVDSARTQLWSSWGAAFIQVCSDRTRGVPTHRKHDEDQAKLASGIELSSSSARKKRGRDRRRSIILPTSVDFQFTVGAVAASANKSSQNTNGTTATELGESLGPRARSTSQSVEKPKRKIRRQSIVSTVSLPSTKVNEGEDMMDVKTPRGHSTPRSTLRSPRQRLRYTRETSALEMVGDEDSDVCQLCCSERALVRMNPCNHTVCASCWGRLTPSSGKGSVGSGTRRRCPWDCEIVTKR